MNNTVESDGTVRPHKVFQPICIVCNTETIPGVPKGAINHIQEGREIPEGWVRHEDYVGKAGVVVGHIKPILAKDIKMHGAAQIEQETPQQKYNRVKEEFAGELTGLIESNPVFNTHRIPARIIAEHMVESAHLFNISLFMHNAAIQKQDDEGSPSE